jgi:hypothetical protein
MTGEFQPAAPPDPPPPGRVPSAEERRRTLAAQIQAATVQGKRVESQQDFQAVLLVGRPVNHVLHAILTFFTCLTWGIVWIVLAIAGGEKRELLTVDEFGNIGIQRV